MLLKQAVLDAIASGDITEVYRSWKRPTVKAGGTLNTSVGQLGILSVDRIPRSQLTRDAAHRAGFASKAALIDSLRTGEGRSLYRVRVELKGVDPRVELRRSDTLTPGDLDELRAAFERFDRKAVPAGLEPLALLRLIEEKPGVRAPDLAASLGVETKWFKARIRRLKARGLTESLRIGYQLSPRGQAALDALDADSDD